MRRGPNLWWAAGVGGGGGGFVSLSGTGRVTLVFEGDSDIAERINFLVMLQSESMFQQTKKSKQNGFRLNFVELLTSQQKCM